MSRVVLQIPLSKELKITAEKAALDYGFSSLQEILRVLMKKLADKTLYLSVKEEPSIHLSEKNEKKYLKAIEDLKKGRSIYHAKDVDDFLKQLDQA